MKESGMAMFWRILSALGFDCFKGTPTSSQRSSRKLGSSRAASMESSSLTGSLSVGSDPVHHCQCCISYASRLRRLSCGHQYCEPCTFQIVNLAFEDIEGLAEYPCPVCKSLHHLSGSVPVPAYPVISHYSPFGSQKQRLVEEEENQWD